MHLRLYRHSISAIDVVARKISKEGLIQFDRRSVVFLLTLLLLFSLQVAFKINRSSMDQLNVYTPKLSTEGLLSSTILGSSKGIRSDEWAVATPFVLSQVHNGFGLENTNIGDKKAALISHYNLPLGGGMALLKPQNYGFFIFDTERGYAFSWGAKTFGTVVSLFLLMMLTLKNNFYLSLIGTATIYYSSFVQWWLSVPVPEIMMSMNVIVISTVYFLYSKSKMSIVGWALVAYIFTLNFVLLFYPPSQVTLGYLLLALIGFFVLQTKNYAKIVVYSRWKVATFTLFIGGVIAFGVYFFNMTAETIDILTATSYPGNRRATGGGFDLARIFIGLFDGFYKEDRYPRSLGNVCEASSFIVLYPVGFVFMALKYIKKQKVDLLEVGLAAYLLIITSWMVLGFPAFLAKITMFNLVPENRVFIGIGLASTIFFLRTISTMEFKLPKYWHIIFSTILFGAIISYGLFLQNRDSFYSYRYIMIVSVFVPVLTYLLASRRNIIALLLMFWALSPHLRVNPFVYGMEAVTNSHFTKEMVSVNNNEQGTWLVYGNVVLANILKANGLDVFNGTSTTPKFSLTEIFKTSSDYKKINRYAFISFETPEAGANEQIKLQSPDSYMVFLSPCSEKIKALGVKYVLFPSKNEEKLVSENCRWEKIEIGAFAPKYSLYKL